LTAFLFESIKKGRLKINISGFQTTFCLYILYNHVHHIFIRASLQAAAEQYAAKEVWIRRPSERFA
jgi:hypothetical protein